MLTIGKSENDLDALSDPYCTVDAYSCLGNAAGASNPCKSVLCPSAVQQ